MSNSIQGGVGIVQGPFLTLRGPPTVISMNYKDSLAAFNFILLFLRPRNWGGVSVKKRRMCECFTRSA